jgi:3-phenylpropionate/cinnamic acid dioxygenase small subunit
MEKQEAEDEEEEDEKSKTTDSHRQLGDDLSKVKTGDAKTTLDAAYQARMERTANAWKGN